MLYFRGVMAVRTHLQTHDLLGKLTLCLECYQKAFFPILCLFGPNIKKEVPAWQNHHNQSDLFIFNFMASGFCAFRPFQLQAGRNLLPISLVLAGFIPAFKFLIPLEFILGSGVRRKPNFTVIQMSAHFPTPRGCFKIVP